VFLVSTFKAFSFRRFLLLLLKNVEKWKFGIVGIRKRRQKAHSSGCSLVQTKKKEKKILNE
jgi:hypothetical protein